MPSMLGGPSSSGNITQTTTNPTQAAQLPFLNEGWNNAQYQLHTHPDPDPAQMSGYHDLINTASSVNDWLRPAANDLFRNVGGMGVNNSPAFYGGLWDIGTGTAPQFNSIGNASAGLSANGTGQNPFYGRVTSAGDSLNYAGDQGLTLGYGGTAPQLALGGIGGQGREIGSGSTAPQARLGGIGSAAMDLGAGASEPQQALMRTGGALTDLSRYAVASPYSGELDALANSTNPKIQTASRGLTDTATGAYLNSNPYLDRMFATAADPVVRQYMTATAPQTDANYEAAGRYGSGALANSRSQNEQDLGRTLDALSSTIYGGNYANERTLQQGAQKTLGDLGINVMQTRGGLLNSAGDLALRGQGLSASELASAGSLYGANANSMIAGLNAGTSAAGTDLSARTAGLNAGTGAYGTDLSSRAAGLNAGTGAYNNEGRLGVDAIGQMTDALKAGGALDLGSLLQRNSALSQMQTGFQQGNVDALQALQLYPSLLQSQFLPAQQEIAGGQGLTGAPWDALTRYLNSVGQPTSGSNSQTSPLLGPSPLSSGLGLLGGASQLNSLLGGGASGGALGSLFGPAAMTTGMDYAGGTGLATIASEVPLEAAAASAWIVCTELMEQGRMPKRWWKTGAKVFNAYPEVAKRGYYVWAIPAVRHLRKKPNSLYSRALEKAFNWRAEDIAARAGVKGARKLWRGRAVTVALALPCVVLGTFAKDQDWQAVYRDEAAA